MQKLGNWVCLAAFAIVLMSCQNSPEELLKTAKGKPEEILIIMDTVLRNSKVGEAIDSIFQEKIPGLLQSEPRYKCIFIKPFVFQEGLREYGNIVTVAMLNATTPEGLYMLNLFSENTLTKIRQDTSLFLHQGKDEYAKGQHLLHIFGMDEEVLAQQLLANKTKIQDYFDKIVREKTAKLLFEERNTTLEKEIFQEHQLNLKIPIGFLLAKSEKKDKEGFIWIRQMDKRFDRSVIIHYEPYRSKSQFLADSVLALRDSICKQHLYEDPARPHTFLVTERLLPPDVQPVNLNNRYALQLRGMWRTNHLSMGGAFISFVWVHEKSGTLYYTEGFLYAPGSTKRDLLRELEVMLWNVVRE
ncbi:MAG: DUF4837 family protein [Cytophagales bacterium]|nr:DUF4837 family protein [Cytophagales bacterium]MDW8384248.1 DUF4837 family protein [Flammeovirgaceae bacterium]